MNRLISLKYLISALLLVCIVGFSFFWLKTRISDERVDPSAGSTPIIPKSTPDSVHDGSTVEISRVSQPGTVIESVAKVTLQASGENAILMDAEGKTLLKAIPTDPIYSIAPSPKGDQLLVSRGNGAYQIYRIEPFEYVRDLPLTPGDTPHATAFYPWNWIDETILIGAVDVERPSGELSNLTAAERESPANWRERTLIYSFNLATGELSKIDTANAGLPQSFRILEMHAGGTVEVEWDEQETARTAWFKARVK